jgi:Domain of unknown function (DUF892)
MADKDLNALFLDTLKDIYYAEKQIYKSLPKMAKAANSDQVTSRTQNIRAFFNAIGHLLTSVCAAGMSPSPPIADVIRWLSDVRFVPIAEVAVYSITSSARARREGGIVRPISLAVFRLMTSSNRVGCSTGRSAGLPPLRIFATKLVAINTISGKWGP